MEWLRDQIDKNLRNGIGAWAQENCSDIQCPAWRTCSDSVLDCGVGIFYNHHGQFVNDGDAMVFHGGYGG